MILRDVLNRSLIERQEEVELMMLGLVARVNVLFIGEPGTAKSLMVDNLLRAISNAHGFSALMHKFLPPEEVMGPLKLSQLQNDVYERAVDGYMPTCNIAFLDEIWKSSPAILNMLLKILNEEMPPLKSKWSDDFKDFVNQCLIKDEKIRPDAEKLL